METLVGRRHFKKCSTFISFKVQLSVIIYKLYFVFATPFDVTLNLFLTVVTLRGERWRAVTAGRIVVF